LAVRIRRRRLDTNPGAWSEPEKRSSQDTQPKTTSAVKKKRSVRRSRRTRSSASTRTTASHMDDGVPIRAPYIAHSD
jgi:hypothetical protein